MPSIVIVGASLAGLRAATAIRASGYDGQVVVVGDERQMPYTRPPLSKELLAGKQEPGQCDFDCASVDALWRLGERASGLDMPARRVLLESGDWIPFDRLIVATGCRAREWNGSGAQLDGLFTLRGMDDALALGDALSRARRLAVVGAGFVGCEVAATARGLGLDVTLIDVADLPLTPLGAETGARARALHERHGVDLRLGVGVAGFSGDDRVRAVELADGTSVDADLAVVALGAIPNTEWVAGLPTERGGVVTDATLTVDGHPDVLCAGDVATWPHDDGLVRVEHWTNAAEQGTLAGRNAVLDHADRRSYSGVPYFWTDQYDVKIQVAGFPGRADASEVVDDVVLGKRAGELVSAVAWNQPRKLMGYRRELATAGALS